MNRVGFMQGRLSPLVGGRIQAFPWEDWQKEFEIAEKNNFQLMEWTLDQDKLYENPLMTPEGQVEIRLLCQTHGVAIPSLTGDCFMQAPFWKKHTEEKEKLQSDFKAIVEACINVGISTIVIPLVDNGSLDNSEQEDVLVSFLESEARFFAENGLKVIFESDFNAEELARFIGLLDPNLFGVNYDIGNSAALGFSSSEEIKAYGNRITNIHVKDRVSGGTTVPLGTGNVDFDAVFSNLKQVGYTGNYILQTARATDNDHAGLLCRYRDMTINWIKHNGT